MRPPQTLQPNTGQKNGVIITPFCAGKAQGKEAMPDQAISRSSRRRIFPTGVIGNDSRSTICLGIL